MRHWVRALPLAASMGILFSGCGSDPKPGAAAAAIPSKPAAVAVAEDPTVKMARAVGDGKPGAAVSIRYDLETKPQVGVPLPVKVMFVPTAGADALEATFSGMDGITLSGNLNAAFQAVKSGSLYPHELTVTPERTGVFYVTVNASTRFGGASMARTFAIPFVVGEQAAQVKAAPQKDAGGKPIQPMRAEEPRG
jgi:hypothetical protein